MHLFPAPFSLLSLNEIYKFDLWCNCKKKGIVEIQLFTCCEKPDIPHYYSDGKKLMG